MRSAGAVPSSVMRCSLSVRVRERPGQRCFHKRFHTSVAASAAKSSAATDAPFICGSSLTPGKLHPDSGSHHSSTGITCCVLRCVKCFTFWELFLNTMECVRNTRSKACRMKLLPCNTR